jgi:predicted AAA+ superfamily ATPase
MAVIHYNRLDYQLYYWRTHHGAEVDLLICRGNKIIYALEIKSSQNIVKENLAGLISFKNDNPDVSVYVLGKSQNRRQLENEITLINWNEFIVEELVKA